MWLRPLQPSVTYKYVAGPFGNTDPLCAPSLNPEEQKVTGASSSSFAESHEPLAASAVLRLTNIPPQTSPSCPGAPEFRTEDGLNNHCCHGTGMIGTGAGTTLAPGPHFLSSTDGRPEGVRETRAATAPGVAGAGEQAASFSFPSSHTRTACPPVRAQLATRTSHGAASMATTRPVLGAAAWATLASPGRENAWAVSLSAGSSRTVVPPF